MATTRFIDHLLEGDHASRPAAGDVPEGTLYSCTTHSLVYQSDTATWATWATLGGSSDLDAIIAASSGQNIADALAGAASPAAGNVFATMADVGGGASDPIFDQFGTPDTAFEFTSSSFTGLTSWGGVTTEDADTTIPGHYYLKVATNSNPYFGGRYASVSQPFTAICKMVDRISLDSHYVGMMLAAATPGAFDAFGHAYQTAATDGALHLQRWTSLGAFGAQIANDTRVVWGGPLWLAIKASSNTSVDYLWSTNGVVWYKQTGARDPSLTLGSVGLVGSAQETSVGAVAAFDFLRIWNSALTFPGG